MKKIILFLVLLIFPMIIYADSPTTFTLDEVTASPGNNVTIKLNMNNKQEFGVLTARVHYDNTKLEYISSEINGLNAALRGAENNPDKGIVALYAINLISGKEMKDNGNILTIEFKIKEDVTDDIPLELEIKDFGTDESTALEYKIQNGIIKIKKDVETISKDKSASLLEEFKEAIKSSNIETDVTWSTTDDSIASVDDDGNVTFNKNGNVTVEAKDAEGNVIYSKDYFVKEKMNKKNYIKYIIAGVALILIILLIVLRKKKCLKRK